jgi:hypothetical protein
MPHQFTPYDEEPKAQPAGSRRGGPPRKSTGVDVLDPPFPPKKPPGPIPKLPRSILIRIFAILILGGLVIAALLMMWKAF